MKDLSVIIPVYNIESELLYRCLDSIIPQLSESNIKWEIIVVDDGSLTPPDLSAYTSTDIHLHTIHHAGLSQARNYGLEQSAAQYIFFVDADDYLFPDSLRPILVHLIHEQPDILRFQLKEVYTKEIKKGTTVGPRFAPPTSGEDFMLSQNLPDAVWLYIFKRRLVTEHHLQFPVAEYLEDNLFTCKLHHYAQSVICSNLNVYAYYQRPGSILHNTDPNHISELRRQHFSNLERMAQFVEQEEKANNPTYGLRRKLTFFTIDYIHRICLTLPWNVIAKDEIPSLKNRKFYPLPNNYNYGLKYILFSLLANNRLGLWLIAKLLWKRKQE